MHDPLTAAEYAAIAETMSFPANAFINGSFRPAASGKTFKTLNPATGKVLAALAACEAADVDFAVAEGNALHLVVRRILVLGPRLLVGLRVVGRRRRLAHRLLGVVADAADGRDALNGKDM